MSKLTKIWGKKTTTAAGGVLAAVVVSGYYYSPGMIASLGQTLAQVPQSMQVSGSM